MVSPYEAAEMDRRIANLIRVGTLGPVDLTTTPARARVVIDPTWTTDYLPVFQAQAGRVSSWSAPVTGEQVMVFSPSGEMGAGAVLRGLNSTAKPAPSALLDMVRLFTTSDGAADDYDAAAKVRTLTVPAGGQLIIRVGDNTVITAADGQIILDAGGTKVVVADGQVTLGGDGGQAVARVGDTVDLHTGRILTGSGVVSAT